ncbi:hypothetical protein BV25DRAFT_378313 [Artomyces pyxidatus]|uniref:Uncharacterized protein n=1 Tax=Artomyces pyxidatus TaxID=48021 RepID=A0ACB8T660_9AGAM|nr:hypothetical protein BV25DRAFT_378313 [Artomyces pyxidatus]
MYRHTIATRRERNLEGELRASEERILRLERRIRVLEQVNQLHARENEALARSYQTLWETAVSNGTVADMGYLDSTPASSPVHDSFDHDNLGNLVQFHIVYPPTPPPPPHWQPYIPIPPQSPPPQLPPPQSSLPQSPPTPTSVPSRAASTSTERGPSPSAHFYSRNSSTEPTRHTPPPSPAMLSQPQAPLPIVAPQPLYPPPTGMYPTPPTMNSPLPAIFAHPVTMQAPLMPQQPLSPQLPPLVVADWETPETPTRGQKRAREDDDEDSMSDSSTEEEERPSRRCRVSPAPAGPSGPLRRSARNAAKQAGSKDARR